MASTKTKPAYENNPFFIATNGITLLMKSAQGVTILLFVLSLASYVRGVTSPDAEKVRTPAQQIDATAAAVSGFSGSEWAVAIGVVVLLSLAAMLLSSLFGGISSYTSARLARGHQVSLSEAFRVSFDNLFSYLWLQIIIFVKVMLWSLLLIIPGIIMAVRYSLSGVAFYDDTKKLRGTAAVKESLRLTKGAWITTYAGSAVLNTLTLYIFSPVVSTAASTILYRQYTALGDKPKPSAHFLSWLMLAIPIVFFLLILTAVIVIISTAGLNELADKIMHSR